MNRAVLNKTNIVAAAVVAVVGVSGGTALVIRTHTGNAPKTVSTQQQLSEISYHGKDGVDALTLLKQRATVTTKHYSFGDLVVSINGSSGNGPKYWTFYVNGKMSQAGAETYKTKASDILTWKLQQL